jgi:hypothetical protein
VPWQVFAGYGKEKKETFEVNKGVSRFGCVNSGFAADIEASEPVPA